VPPSIKGVVLGGHAEALAKYLASHAVDGSVLERHFVPGDLELLGGWIHPTTWYEIGIYARLLGFLREEMAQGSNQFLIDAGRRTAESLIRAGTYPPFEYLRQIRLVKESSAGDRFLAFGRDLQHLMAVHALMLNFAPNRLVIDPDHADRYVIEHVQADAYPEVLCWTTTGFCNRMAEEHGSPGLWRWERPRRDTVWYRMTRPV